MDILFDFYPKAKKDIIDQHLNVKNTREVPLKNDAFLVETNAMINIFVKSVKENGEDTAFPCQRYKQMRTVPWPIICVLPSDMVLVHSFQT